ncbi:hypothetical protein [Serratia ficaria]|uniref:hypothetical protein n=1 Tax=Serratia ficaria TaxID=61651 RepID=UPI0021C992D1|nr:hypothetical protein [Serratia ficaria]
MDVVTPARLHEISPMGTVPTAVGEKKRKNFSARFCPSLEQNAIDKTALNSSAHFSSSRAYLNINNYRANHKAQLIDIKKFSSLNFLHINCGK